MILSTKNQLYSSPFWGAGKKDGENEVKKEKGEKEWKWTCTERGKFCKKNNTERALKKGEGKNEKVNDQYTKNGPFNFQIFLIKWIWRAQATQIIVWH